VPSRDTAVATTKQTKRTLLRKYLAETRPGRVTEAELPELQQRLAPVSERYLRRLLRESGIPLDPMVEGIRQDSFESLERTLLAMAEEYRKAQEGGAGKRARACRREVITAKDHARLAARRLAAPEARSRKDEMISWMMVWLENPAVFPRWVRLRRKQLAAEGRNTQR